MQCSYLWWPVSRRHRTTNAPTLLMQNLFLSAFTQTRARLSCRELVLLCYISIFITSTAYWQLFQYIRETKMNQIDYKFVGAACGIGLLAYCLYFDHKRRNAPDYREKVMARRERQRKARENDDIELPPSDDKDAIEKFFVKEIEIGEELLQSGEVERAVKHLSYAVVFCPQPQSLLQYMKEILPASAYVKLVENVAIANKRVKESYQRIVIQEVQDDEVE